MTQHNVATFSISKVIWFHIFVIKKEKKEELACFVASGRKGGSLHF